MANPPPPPGTTAVMILRDANNGDYEIYDIGNNSLLAAYFLGQVGLDWQPAGGLADSVRSRLVSASMAAAKPASATSAAATPAT
jgi:hypothetical protein